MKGITVIGGGIAGLSLGIALRQNRVPVRVIEAKGYPRHKVCGEFVSGRGLKILTRLGLSPAKLGVAVESISFHSRNGASASKPLPEQAFAIPRIDLDFALMTRFVDLGGELNCPCRFQPAEWEEGHVCATGRRPAKQGQFKWFGLKGHVQNLELKSDLEIHFVPDGYVGLCKVGDRGTNICGLFRRSRQPTGDSPDVLEHFQREPSIGPRLANVSWQRESLVAVAALPIEQDESTDKDLFAIGDALSMTPPFTGNGISLAVESAAMAAPHLTRYASGEISWREATHAYQAEARKIFFDRIRFSRKVQKVLLTGICRLFLSTAVQFTPVWHKIFFATR